MAANARSSDPPKPQQPFSFPPDGPTHRNHTQGGLQVSPRLRIVVTGLPPKTSTLDIYENFCRYGSVVRIYLFETREGFKSTRAEVDFLPAPATEFWRRSLLFETKSRQSVRIQCQLIRTPPQSYFKESPVRRGVKYNERTELEGKSLDFGVLTHPTTMMVMARSGAMQNKPKLVLNLHRKEIEVHFPWQQISINRSAVRTFRFLIALDEEFKIWQLPDRSFVLHLTKPPWYSKQLAEAIANTHSPDAQVWSIEDTWARQTDLWTYKQRIPEINSLPVALPKHLNDINISRWTTFRFDPVSDVANTSIARNFVDALKDWNVKVLNGDSFNTFHAQSDLDKAAWKLINSTHTDQATSPETRPDQIQLPFSVRYQLEVCLSHGWLSEYSITAEFLKQLSEWPEKRAKQALLYIAMDQKSVFDPMTIFKDIHYSKPVRAKRLPNNCIEICSATVTSTGILFHTPAVEITNRIIRNHKSHANRFLRVRFEDDEYRGQTRLYPATNNKMVMIFTRVKRALINGIKLGNITYDFLAWGNSQLREHGAYFFAGSDELTADSIREEMGNFKEIVVAKKAARMGQCFSTTRPVRLPLKMIYEPDTIPDIVRNGYTFTDGVGKISPEAAELVASELQIQGPTPCLFQFRLGGCKGVLAVSNDVPGVDVRIRKSQHKFSSLSTELEINRYAQFWQPSLNRQIILCLSSLGVPTEIFIRKQDETIMALNRAMNDDGAAINALRSNVDPNMMTLSLSYLVEAGFRESQEPFVISLLELWRAWSLKYLKEKAKIPVEKGAFVLGTVDETATLQGHTSASPSGYQDEIMKDPTYLENLPEIFIQVTNHKTGQQQIIEGICILARNPSLHRGDIRVVRARNIPALHHMCDVVVMSQLGDRDLPSMCSGGDLDGDDYIVIWDHDLIPQFWNAEPFHYDPPVPKTATGEIKTSDLVDFFHDYMQNDALGKIANAHLAAADFLDNGLENPICLDLVQLHSMAVDYPKTGIAAKMEHRLERTQKPHFMEPKYGRSYHSNKVLGQLYDKINKFHQKTKKDAFVKHNLNFDSRILDAFDPDTELLEKVGAVKYSYDVSLRRILTQHSIRTEFELWSTFVLEHSKKSRDYKFHEEVGDLSRVLKEEYYEELCNLAGGRDFDHLAPVAVAAYKLARDQRQAAKLEAEAQGEDQAAVELPFISFPWVLQDALIKICGLTGDGKKQTTTEAGMSCDNDKTAVLANAEEDTVDELHDVANFHLTRSKLAPHLPDPLATSFVVDSRNGIDNKSPEVYAKAETAAVSEAPDTHSSETSSTMHETDESRVGSVESVAGDAKTDRGSVTGETPEVLLDHTIWAHEGSINTIDKTQCCPTDLDGEAAKERLRHEISTSETYQHTPILDVLSSPKLPDISPRRRSNRQMTCFSWKTNRNCRYSDYECKYAHHETGFDMSMKQQFTCHFWLNGNGCTFNQEMCQFAHHDTGYHAPQPHGSISSNSKRVVAEDSDSDVEYLRPTRPTARFPWKPKTSYWGNDYAAKQERINRRNGQRPDLCTSLNLGTELVHERSDKDVFVTVEQTAKKPSIEEHIATEVAPTSDGVDGSPQYGSVQTSPSRVQSSSSRGDGFTVNGASGCLQQSGVQPRQSRHRDVKNISSSVDDLTGLVFDDAVVLPQKDNVSDSEGSYAAIASRTVDTSCTSVSDDDLIDMHSETIRQHALPIRQAASVAPVAPVDSSSSPKFSRPQSVASSDLLLDDFEIIKPNQVAKSSIPQDSFSSELINTPSSHDSSIDHPEHSIILKETTDFKDPLTHDDDGDADRDADDEPEIEEIFD